MPYPEQFLVPMRADLTRFGVAETRTPQGVDRVLEQSETVLMVVNSVWLFLDGSSQCSTTFLVGPPGFEPDNTDGSGR